MCLCGAVDVCVRGDGRVSAERRRGPGRQHDGFLPVDSTPTLPWGSFDQPGHGVTGVTGSLLTGVRGFPRW